MSASRWLKMIAGGLAVGVGGPALVYYISPSEEELFKKYSPDLQKRSLENRQQRQEDFDEFVNKLKDYSKSDKPIWVAAAEDEKRKKQGGFAQASKKQAEEQARRDEIKQQALK